MHFDGLYHFEYLKKVKAMHDFVILILQPDKQKLYEVGNMKNKRKEIVGCKMIQRVQYKHAVTKQRLLR